jgi:hypothetical protein
VRNSVVCVLVAGCMLLAAACPLSASDDSRKSIGVRAGYGHNPDQFVIGAQADLGEVYSRIHFVPSIDAGFGDHMTTVTLNGDVKLYVPLPESSVMLYGLAGPALTIWSPEGGDGDTEIGLYLGAGTRMPLGDNGWYNLEVRFGISDVPDLRILLGVLFGGR